MKQRLIFALLVALSPLLFTSCSERRDESSEGSASSSSPAFLEHVELEDATEFTIDRYEDGYLLLTVADGARYVVVPEGMAPSNLGYPESTVVKLPCDSVYLAGSSATDFIIRLGALDAVTTCGTKSDDYAIASAREAIEAGSIRYVGKYSAPSYETLLAVGCDLAIESTMIYHVPKVREQLQRLGVPVVVERSCYESSPLGRLEWVKFYGALFGKEGEATSFFDAEKAKLSTVTTRLASADSTRRRPKVAFFYLSSNGYVNVRKPGDYLCRIIELVGGEYAFGASGDEERNALSTINIDWEAFYRSAVDADILVYNGSIDSSVTSVSELIGKNPLFRDFKGVKDGNVWLANANMYQENSRVVELILDFDRVVNGSEETSSVSTEPLSGARFLSKLE